MFSEPITLRNAVLRDVHNQMSNGKLQTRIVCVGTLSQELAELLGAKTIVYRENGTPREGFQELKLDTSCAAFRAVFEADPALKQSFELASGDSSDQYRIKRMEDGSLQLSLRLNFHSGDVYRLFSYWTALGDGDSLLKITPLQTAIADKPKRNNDYKAKAANDQGASDEDEDQAEGEDANDEDARYLPISVDEGTREAARQTLITARRHGRQKATAGV